MPSPRGNLNALKHGLYARHFSADEKTDLRKMPTNSALQEIAALRLCAQRALDLFNRTDDPDKKADYIRVAVDAISSVVTAMVKEQVISGSSPVLEDLWIAIRKANEMDAIDVTV